MRRVLHAHVLGRLATVVALDRVLPRIALFRGRGRGLHCHGGRRCCFRRGLGGRRRRGRRGGLFHGGAFRPQVPQVLNVAAAIVGRRAREIPPEPRLRDAARVFEAEEGALVCQRALAASARAEHRLHGAHGPVACGRRGRVGADERRRGGEWHGRGRGRRLAVRTGVYNGGPEGRRRRDGPEGGGGVCGALVLVVGAGALGERDDVEDPFRDGQRGFGDGARPGARAGGEEGIVDDAGRAGPRGDLDVAGRRARELGLVHLPDGGIHPDEFVEAYSAIAAHVKNADLRPIGVLVDVEIVDGWETFAIHDGHILGADRYEILDADVGKVVLEQHQRLLAQLCIDATLGIGREPLDGLRSSSASYRRDGKASLSLTE